MSFSPLASELLGPLFATNAMRACFSDTAWVSSMLAVETALARSESQFGLAPIALAPAIEAIRPEDLDIAAIGVRAGVAGVPTAPFVQTVQARLPAELERSFHKGATPQDILDTALVLRIRDALMLIAVVEHAVEQVRQSGASLADVLAQKPTARDAGVDLTAAFDLVAAVEAAAQWVAPALNHADGIRARLASDD
jgi:adenylosuccinate lyase